YPGAIRVDPVNGRWLYVVNSNSDLRFNDGTLAAIDLSWVDGDRNLPGAWGNLPTDHYNYPSSSPGLPPQGAPTHSAYCCWDMLDRNVLNCDERGYIKSAVKIGSFGSAIDVQQVTPGSDPAGDPRVSRLFVGVRGNASITWADVHRQPGASDPNNPQPESP